MRRIAGRLRRACRGLQRWSPRPTARPIRARSTEQTQQLNEALEQRATLLERTADRDPAREAQETFAGGRADLAQQAERELRTVVADAEKAFQQVFAQARRLLGDSWPLGEALSLAAAGEERPTP